MKPIVNGIVSGCVRDDNLYCVSGSLNCLVKISLTDFKVTPIYKFDSEDRKVQREVFSIYNMLFCVSLVGFCVVTYDFVSEKVECYHLDNSGQVNAAVYKIENYLWILPKRLDGKLIKFSIEARCFEEELLWNASWRGKDFTGDIVDSCCRDSIIYATLRNSNEFIKYDVLQKKINIINLPIKKNLCSVVQKGNSLYFTVENEAELYVWKEGEELIEGFRSEVVNMNENYIRAISVIDNIILLKGSSVDIFNGSEIVSLDMEEIETVNKAGSLFFSYIEYNNNYYLLPVNAKKILEVDRNFRNILMHRVMISAEDFFQMTETCEEEENLQLLDYISTTSDLKENQKINSNFVGLNIYNEIIKG